MRRSEPLRALVRETTLDARRPDLSFVHLPRQGRAHARSAPCRECSTYRWTKPCAKQKRPRSSAWADCCCLGCRRQKTSKAPARGTTDGIVQQALRALKQSRAAKKLVLIADVCLCEYTSHGHCGVVVKSGDGFEVDNDPTLELLARTAVSQAKAGADVVAPSDMMDGRVAAIRSALDEAGCARNADPELRIEVRFGFLRALSRGGRFGAAVRRSAQLPDGRGQSPRSACARSISTWKRART